MVFNEGLNKRRIKHVFRGLFPDFARDLLKPIRTCSVEIEHVLGGSSRKKKCSRKPARRGMKVLGIHRPHTHTRLITRDWRCSLKRPTSVHWILNRNKKKKHCVSEELAMKILNYCAKFNQEYTYWWKNNIKWENKNYMFPRKYLKKFVVTREEKLQ